MLTRFRFVLVALTACGGIEVGAGNDAAGTCHFDACTFDPNRPPLTCCTEACVGAPCDARTPPCNLPCRGGLSRVLTCSGGRWNESSDVVACTDAGSGT
jgi:hypothetical protein